MIHDASAVPTPDTSIELTEVHVDLGGVSVLRDVSVRVAEKRIAVIGANGSGKSTFARLLNGLVTPTAGQVRVRGLDPVRQGKAVRRLVGFIFTNADAQIVMPTVGEDVAFSLRGRGLSGAEVQAKTTRILTEYGLAEFADRPAHDLSGGQKQLLGLCSVLVSEPGILVADEPTTLLDAANTRRVRGQLAALPQQQVIVTHDLTLAAECDVALLFDEGRLIDRGTPTEIIDYYQRTLC